LEEVREMRMMSKKYCSNLRMRLRTLNSMSRLTNSNYCWSYSGSRMRRRKIHYYSSLRRSQNYCSRRRTDLRTRKSQRMSWTMLKQNYCLRRRIQMRMRRRKIHYYSSYSGWSWKSWMSVTRTKNYYFDSSLRRIQMRSRRRTSDCLNWRSCSANWMRRRRKYYC
jgi:hypothetical protein